MVRKKIAAWVKIARRRIGEDKRPYQNIVHGLKEELM
jgi:hypothetical protein